MYDAFVVNHSLTHMCKLESQSNNKLSTWTRKISIFIAKIVLKSKRIKIQSSGGDENQEDKKGQPKQKFIFTEWYNNSLKNIYIYIRFDWKYQKYAQYFEN